jgi:alpha/beta superfamily hydrolase
MNDEIKNFQNEKIEYAFHEGSSKNRHLLIIGHGVTGNMDRTLIVKLAEAVADQGLPVLRFSFSGNGNSGGHFEESTISKEIQDLQCVINSVVEQGWRPIYAGHSMGGAVGALTAAIDSRIQLLISLAGMVETEQFCNKEFGMLTPGNGNMWDDENCPLSPGFVKDMKQIKSVLPRASGIEIPWLVVHGTNDDLVPVADSRSLITNHEETRQCIEIEGADHLFSGEAISELTEIVIDWLGRKL